MELGAVSTSYRRWAPIYDHTFGAITNAGRRRATRYLTEKGGSVLEVGVGTGLALPGYGGSVSVTGIDYSGEMLAKARERVAREKLERVAGLEQMDARSLTFSDASFDHAAAMHVLSVVPEPERVMAEIARVVRPGGSVVIVNHFTRGTGLLGQLEKWTAPLENLLGWQSDFPISRVLGEPRLVEIERGSLPPFGMMSWLVLRKTG